MVYDKDILREILSHKDFRTVDSDGRVLPPSHPVFLAVADAMAERGSHITKKHVHTIVNNNRSNIRDTVLKIFCDSKKNDGIPGKPLPRDIDISITSTDSETSLPKKNLIWLYPATIGPQLHPSKYSMVPDRTTCFDRECGRICSQKKYGIRQN